MSLQKNNQKGTIIFCVGVRGAGKTTTINQFKKNKDILILTPSTTRAKRDENDDEYNFIDPENWQPDEFAWEINIGETKYGMTKLELEKSKDYLFSISVFDPGSFQILKNFRENSDYELLTIGFDTIDSIDKQKKRVENHSARIMSKKEFLSQREIVTNCDVVVRGDQDQIYNAICAVFACLSSRGGIIQQSTINSFLGADVLLQNATSDTSPASYDLRLGDDVWCQGEFSTLSEKKHVLKIPPYSYAIVSALELANLPCFIAARFDLKNSLFFRGVILSNGPQIDPGYRGALFCMLYNGSDQPVGISRGTHFATIEFITTSGIGVGYRDKYQGKTALRDFMPDDAAVSEGGKILERTEKKIEKISDEWKSFRAIVFTILAIAMTVIISPSLVVYFNMWGKVEDARKEYVTQTLVLKDLEVRLKELEIELKESKKNSPANERAKH